jgi:2-polyprenyl-6-hydroxyphenyl methylase/3-demethylubiquinone-9 3-methyltransferase
MAKRTRESPEAQTAAPSVDEAEVAKFTRLAASWWDEAGAFRPLHRMNPARISIVRDVLAARFARDVKAEQPLAGLRVLDIGCGGGLVAEPLTRLGAQVTGIDASAENIGVARAHAEAGGLLIDYRAATAEALAAEGLQFDAVLALEVIEHVPSAPGFVALASRLVMPDGLLIVSTINRTLKALALAKLGAEYVLRWAPIGTHDFRKFVRPLELRAAFEAAGLVPRPPTGFVYDPLKDDWRASLDCDVNYVMWGREPHNI